MSFLRPVVSSPLSMIIGVIPYSSSVSAPNKPAGPAPIIMIFLLPSAFFHTGSSLVRVSAGVSPIYAL